MLTILFLGLTGCSSASTGTDSPSTTDTDSITGATDSGGTGDAGARGCVSGRLRDSNNASGASLQVDAFRPDLCEPLGSTTSGSDGNFCLQGLPVGETVILQATFTERCPWAHARSVTLPSSGTCETDDCTILDTWYECQGDAATCP